MEEMYQNNDDKIKQIEKKSFHSLNRYMKTRKSSKLDKTSSTTMRC